MIPARDEVRSPASHRPRRDDGPPLRIIAVALTIFLFPFSIVVFYRAQPTDYLDRWIIVFPFEFAIVFLVISTLTHGRELLRKRIIGLPTLAWFVLSLVMTLSFLVHASPLGVITLTNLWGIGCMAAAITEVDTEDRRQLVLGIIGVSAMESVWALAQRIRGGGLGLDALGEWPNPLRNGPQGSLLHAYVLAALALIAASIVIWWASKSDRPHLWAPLVALLACPVGLTYGRSAALGALCLAGATLFAWLKVDRRRGILALLVGLCLGIAVPAAIWSDGWLKRADQTTTSGDVTSGRTVLMSDAFHLIEEHPVFGVGTGRYQGAIQRKKHLDPNIAKSGTVLSVHNLPLLAGAEGGILAFVVMSFVLMVLGWRAFRTGPYAVGLYLAFLPFCLFDRLAYDLSQGTILTGIWIGILELQARLRRQETLSPAGSAGDREFPL